MDIEILLWFQNIRMALGPIVEMIVSFLSDAVCYGAVIIPFIIYWIKDKKFGAYLVSIYAFSSLFNQFIKATFTIHRPWIRDTRIQTSEYAKRGATGYSFPSTHTQTNMAIDGGAYIISKKNSEKIIHVLLIIFMALSRLFVGVHTPQDVIVAILIGGISILVTKVYLQAIENDTKRDTYLMILFFVIAILCTLYAELKAYPMNYANGELLVDPITMKKDSLRSIGAFIGILFGIYLEKKYVNFSVDGTRKEKILRLVIGLLGVGVLFAFSRILLPKVCAVEIARFIETFLLTIYVLFLYPYIFTKYKERNQVKPNSLK